MTYRINKSHEKLTLFIVLCYLFPLQILDVSAEPKTEIFYHKKLDAIDFDVTTIYRISNISNWNTNEFLNPTRFKNPFTISEAWFGCDLIEIHSRTNSIGLPIQNTQRILKTNVNELYNNGLFHEYTNVSFNQVFKIRNTTVNLNDEYPGFMNQDLSYTALKFSYNGYSIRSCEYDQWGSCKYNTNVLKLDWVPDKNQTCITISYDISSKNNIYNNFNFSIHDEYNNVIVSRILEHAIGIQTLKVTDMTLVKDNKYRLSIDYEWLDNYNQMYLDYSLVVLRIAQCSIADEEEFQIFINDNFVSTPKPFTILGSKQPTLIESKLCLNGGRQIGTSMTKCFCPPGFKGEFCETGCGPNLYGADCTGVCSMHPSKQCRGMLMCTSYGCTCPVGLTGTLCSEDCESGKYGANCEQTCSSKCFNNTCDQYTGICSQECSTGYVPPDCKKKYPYLIEQPIQISNTFATIEIKFDLQSSNIGGDKNIKLKFYQLFYKSLNEDEFAYSEINEISEISNSTTAILNDLEPDTSYIIGVLVITNDGNFNDQDIVYGQYSTSCLQPQINDYNVGLIPGVKSVNITWNKIITKKFECKVYEYVLMLTSHQSKNGISGTQELILSGSDSGHVIDDLYPGCQYKITMTPKTSKGSLQSSFTYSFSPFMSEEDIKIKDIITSVNYDKIKVSWTLGLSAYPYEALVKNPVTCVIRYKLNRIYSCSLKEIENSNWTSIQIYNQTNYEIFDTVPNSQYIIKVGVLKSFQRENMVYFYTPSSNPQTKLEIDINQPISVTNNSVNVQWNADSINCTKLNGFLIKFYIELKETSSNILQIRETKENYISFDKLNSNSTYEMKVFIKTHFGYNPEQFLFVNFTTKLENLKPVDDLMLYKKSMKSRMVGLRWSFLSENTNLNGFIVSFNQNLSNVSVIPPTKCSAWPEYYCHTFYNLNFSKLHSKPYTFKIRPMTPEYPNGGVISSISFNANDGLPDSPVNVKVQYVGNTNITVQWDIPWIFNSVLKMFVINVEDISHLDNVNTADNISPIEIQFDEELPTYNYTVTNLEPGFTYSFGVMTVSKSLWYSSPARITVTTLTENK